MRVLAILALILELATLIVTLRRELHDNNINIRDYKTSAKKSWWKLKKIISRSPPKDTGHSPLNVSNDN